jgi:erythromycin esterase-like protein/predicted phosphoribosyltransferase
MRYRDRIEAGRELARHLNEYAGRSDVLVLALPKGGVPVAAQVAARLGAPLDVFLVRKLGVPSHPELAMGAIAEGGVRVLSQRLIRDLGIPSALVEQTASRERLTLDRHDALFRAGRTRASAAGKTAILVDDGLATGATMEAAVLALREQKPSRVVVAAPVGASETCARLARIADRVVCPRMPEPFSAVGLWYERFDQTTDDEVRQLLGGLASTPTSGTRAPAPSPRGHSPVDVVRRCAQKLTGGPRDYDALIDAIGNARVVLIGEATHGTHEFYRHRALITGRLIREKGFRAVAVEADWPDAYRVNRYVRGVGADQDGVEALADFRRFPAWMWRNADVLDFVGWLREFNTHRRPEDRAGFYGLDLYSLRASAEAVLSYLQKVDPEAAVRARQRYACFDRFGDEMQAYAYATGSGLHASCEQEVLRELVELRRRAADYSTRDGRIAADEYFVAEQNARLVRNAEEYYRTMLRGRVESWNLRDRHMAETLRSLRQFLGRSHADARVVVWAHNSHLGDARATELSSAGELNLGQLVREEFGAEAILIGMTTHTGSVTAAHAWEGPAQRRHVRPSLPGSYERLFHDTHIDRFLLPLGADPEVRAVLGPPRLERAIGVIYAPQTERMSHYFHAALSDQFDYVLHFDETRAVEPLERTAVWDVGEVAETYPSGL